MEAQPVGHSWPVTPERVRFGRDREERFEAPPQDVHHLGIKRAHDDRHLHRVVAVGSTRHQIGTTRRAVDGSFQRLSAQSPKFHGVREIFHLSVDGNRRAPWRPRTIRGADQRPPPEDVARTPSEPHRVESPLRFIHRNIEPGRSDFAERGLAASYDRT